MSDYIIHNGTLMSSELYHHGVKGMKWGVRRYRNADGTLTPAGEKRAADKEQSAAQKAQTKAYKNLSKNRSTLTNKQINDQINRLELERKLKDMTDKATQTRVTAAKKYVGGILATAGKQAFTHVATNAMVYGVKIAMDAAIGKAVSGNKIKTEHYVNLAKGAVDFIANKPKNK